MCKRVFIAVCAALLCASALFADLRSSVALVECEPNSAFVESFSLISRRFEQAGNSEAADYFDSLQKGWHGSGFLFQSEDGDLVLVTNRHVIKYSEAMKILFRGVGGEEQELKGNFEIIEDQLLDLAVITFPGTDEYSPLLLADTGEIRDGIQVYAAGYPGLMGEPLWQLSQGIVTNQRVEIDQLVDPELGYLI
jgi:serine protease Do